MEQQAQPSSKRRQLQEQETSNRQVESELPYGTHRKAYPQGDGHMIITDNFPTDNAYGAPDHMQEEVNA